MTDRMKTATYRGLDGKDITVDYDPEAPCLHCGLPVVEASVGGTGVCPWCDTGIDRHTGERSYRVRRATREEYAAAVEGMRHG